MLRGLKKLKYYLMVIGNTLRIVIFLSFLSLVLTLLSGIELSVRNITLLLTLNYEPQGFLDALAQMIILFAELSPIMAFVESKTLTREDKAELKASLMENHIIVVGCGHLGRKIVGVLEELSLPYVLVVRPEDRANNETVIQLLKKGRPIVFGDATITDTLIRAGIEKARAIIIAVNNDTLNALIAEKAKKINPRVRTVVRIFSDELASLLTANPNFDEIMSTTSISKRFFVFGSFFDVVIEDELISIKASKKLVGKTVRNIESLGVNIIAIKRGSHWIKVSEDTEILNGDTIVFLGSKDTLRKFIDKFS